jgi:hypothetical protein
MERMTLTRARTMWYKNTAKWRRFFHSKRPPLWPGEVYSTCMADNTVTCRRMAQCGFVMVRGHCYNNFDRGLGVIIWVTHKFMKKHRGLEILNIMYRERGFTDPYEHE